MLGAIYTALSGLNAYSQGLQTVSSNVANLNSDGYKADTITFSDLLGSSGASSFQEGSSQPTGNGVRLASPFIDFSQGQLIQTGNALDLAIQGNGFLVLLNKSGSTFYARTGSFAIDRDGFISDQVTGFHLAVLNSSNQPVALNVNGKKTNPPAATTKITFADNLSSSATTASVSNINVFDDRGAKQVWTVTFTKATPTGTTGVTDSWNVAVTDANGNQVGTGTLNFIGSTVDPSTSTLSVTGTTKDGASALNVTLDFSGVTSFSAGTASTIATSSVDGHGEGTLTGVTVTDAGQVQLAYSNGQTQLEGAVALANVEDPQLLQRAGNGVFQNNGADIKLLASGVEGVGRLLSGQLESSNVNLSSEFSRLILVQRGFQASSEVLSIANEMIQQLFGIRGQGA